MSDNIIIIDNLKKYYEITGGVMGKVIAHIRAVDDVSFQIKQGETLGLVGESGCGKSTLGRCLLFLLDITSGNIKIKIKNEKNQKIHGIKEYDLTELDNLKELRREMQIVHQDPFESLDPRMLVKDIIAEPLKTHKFLKGKKLQQRIIELLEQVGLGEEHLYRYPHELSGGQQQRVCIARAIALNPSFIVLDEPTSALDVSVQAQILNLLKNLQGEYGLTYLFISHDIGVIDYMSDRIAVMYLGKIIELAKKDKIMKHSLHPYTKALLSSIPTTDPKNKMLDLVTFLKGDVPSPMDPPLGCRFHTRCPNAFEKCGWEGRDLVEYFRENQTYLDIDDLEFTPAGYRIGISIKEGKLGEVMETIKKIFEKEKTENPLFKSIKDIRKKENNILIDFYESKEPILTNVENNHLVGCFLYDEVIESTFNF
jgi:oligopeptide/dipeptide ABC transporter ATP-binding protein